MNERVTLTPFCIGCNPGFHLPLFIAVHKNIFADHGLDVKIFDPPMDSGLSGPERVAQRASDFCLTAVTYFLLAQARSRSTFSARFAGVIYQRSPLTAIVLNNGEILCERDLRARRAAWSPSDIWPGAEYGSALSDRGLAAPNYVQSEKTYAIDALLAGTVEVLPRNANIVAGMQATGFDVAGIPLPSDHYSAGLVVGDHVPLEVATRMTSALSEAMELQRQIPDEGLRAISRSGVGADVAIAHAQWIALEPYIFGQAQTLSMEADSWAGSISWLCKTHQIDTPLAHTVYRPEMLAQTTSNDTLSGASA